MNTSGLGPILWWEAQDEEGEEGEAADGDVEMEGVEE
jgi:hypothetical protein